MVGGVCCHPSTLGLRVKKKRLEPFVVVGALLPLEPLDGARGGVEQVAHLRVVRQILFEGGRRVSIVTFDSAVQNPKRDLRKRVQGLLFERHGQNLALTVLYVPYDSISG